MTLTLERKDSLPPNSPLEADYRHRMRASVTLFLLASRSRSGSHQAFSAANHSLSGVDLLRRFRSPEEVEGGRLFAAPHDQDSRRDSVCRRYRDGAGRLVLPAFLDHRELGSSCVVVVQRAGWQIVLN